MLVCVNPQKQSFLTFGAQSIYLFPLIHDRDHCAAGTVYYGRETCTIGDYVYINYVQVHSQHLY